MILNPECQKFDMVEGPTAPQERKQQCSLDFTRLAQHE